PAALLPLLALADLSTPACVVGDGTYQGDAGLGQAGLGRAGPGRAEGRTAWDETVRVATNAPRAVLSDARLVAALRPLTADELGSLRIGTAAAPEDGALACLAVAGIAVVEGVAPFTDAAGAGAAGAGAARLAVREAGVASPAADAASEAGTTREAGEVNKAAVACGVGPADKVNAAGEADAVTGKGGSTRLLLRVSGPGVPGTRAIIVTGLPAGFAAARAGLVSGFPAGADLLLIAPDGAMTGLPRTTALREEASR
ncbi:MAG TPA: phosphonate C-P lyase system protein PhnH, partial [Gemmataceae bacterium]|nr:phosphonate C-P lyase system protein PhnH [Gemmataceae bacterium]